MIHKFKTIIFFTILVCNVEVEAQLVTKVINRIGIEAGYNYSLHTNRSTLSSYTVEITGIKYETQIYDQSNAYNFNHNISLNYTLNDRFDIRLRYSQFNIDRIISGSIPVGEFNDRLELENYTNEIENKSIGIIGRYNKPIGNSAFIAELGLEKQKFKIFGEPFILPTLNADNFAAYSSIGYQTPRFKSFSLLTKFYMNYSIRTKSLILDHYNVSPGSEFIPVSYGVELALQYRFDIKGKARNEEDQ